MTTSEVDVCCKECGGDVKISITPSMMTILIQCSECGHFWEYELKIQGALLNSQEIREMIQF